MHNPPFKLAAATQALAGGTVPALRCVPGCCAQQLDDPADGTGPARVRLSELNPQLYCSVIGTCLSTPELRKLMARHIDVHGLSDLELHHEAVSAAGQGGDTARALHKALDRRHQGVIARLSRVRDAQQLCVLWEQSLQQGEVPGAYWALLTHRDATPELKHRIFGDVHMLSHLVGAANRADLRRLVALEQDNADLRERLDRQQLRMQELLAQRDGSIAARLDDLAQLRRAGAVDPGSTLGDVALCARLAAAETMVALQTGRREQAEQSAAGADAEIRRLREELAHVADHASTLGRELGAAETQLRELSEDAAAPGALAPLLRGQRILYVGGRPSSTPAIRDLVVRHGGAFQRHDGGLEDRKATLAAGVSWASRVVFPVDCVDHDSVANLKRLCARHGVGFIALRSASVGCFAAALTQRPPQSDSGDDGSESAPPCRHHR
jgi:hypothetical protein